MMMMMMAMMNNNVPNALKNAVISDNDDVGAGVLYDMPPLIPQDNYYNKEDSDSNNNIPPLIN